MKARDLPGQTVWVDVGTPVLFDSASDAPDPVQHFVYVKIERVTEAADDRPGLAIWRVGERERGVDAAIVANHVMSMPPTGDAWIVRAGTKLGDKLGVSGKKR